MEPAIFTQVRKSLDLPGAFAWLKDDAADDHFSDPIRFKDAIQQASSYLGLRDRRLFQHHAQSWQVMKGIKPAYFLREIVVLPILCRILYLAVLKHFLPKLDPRLPKDVYSYRADNIHCPDDYPFSRRNERWKDFDNDFRRACLDGGTQAVLSGDIASFYEHISVSRLVEVVLDVLGGGATAEDRACAAFLADMLNSWTADGFGIPVNFDPSSFFCSVFLTPVDRYMTDDRRYRYFRWVDDMKVVATSKGQAIRALHDLQVVLKRYGLYLSTAKTKIIERGTPAFETLLDVSDDVSIAELESALASRNFRRMGDGAAVALQRLQYHAGPQGDDRKFRAFANRLAHVAVYTQLRDSVWPTIRRLVLPRLESHPEKSDTWVKLLSQDVDDEVQNAVWDILTTSGKNIFDWQRMYLWELLIRAEKPIQPRLLELARPVARSSTCDAVSARAIILVGRTGDNIVREQLYHELFARQTSWIIQRSVLIAIQELPREKLDRFYDQAVKIEPEHTELVEYLRTVQKPIYTVYQRQEITIPPEERSVVDVVNRGIGKVNGKVVTYRLSRFDYDYE